MKLAVYPLGLLPLSPLLFPAKAENLAKCFSKWASFDLKKHYFLLPMQIRQDFLAEIQRIIAASKEAAIRSVDHHRVLLYWHLGQKVFEEEQEGKERAGYGTYLIRSLSQKSQPVYSSGFSVRQLERSRQIYRTFPIASTLRTQFSWTHYRLLMRIDKDVSEVKTPEYPTKNR